MTDSADSAAIIWYDSDHDDCPTAGRHGHRISDDSIVTTFDASQATEDDCEVCGHELLWDAGERMMYCPNTWEHG